MIENMQKSNLIKFFPEQKQNCFEQFKLFGNVKQPNYFIHLKIFF